MAKKNFLLFIAMLICSASFSQKNDEPDPILIPGSYNERNFTFEIGPTIGLGVAKGTDTSYGFGFDSGLAFQIGASGKMHFGHRYESSPSGTGLFGTSVAIIYESRMPSIKKQALTMHCIEVPVLLQFYPIASLASEFALEAGVTFIKILKCSPEQLQINDIVLQTGQLSSSDVMLSLGTSYQAPFHLSIGLRYNLGLMPLAGNLDSRISTFHVSVAYMFEL